jgi:protein-L-isoaspartate(D-aspartate) O-methyltransferase
VTGEGFQGYAEEAPYDLIHVGVGVPMIPEILYEQLNVGGYMVLPMENL